MAIRNATSADNPLAQFNVRQPSHWVHEPKTRTRTELFEKRKADKIPDPSYDLDGDGQVGGQDLVLGRRFDKDNDGRLNTAELETAKQAIKDGVHDQYVWGVEQSGRSRPYRIMQKRGVIIDNDDFGPVEATYPKEERPNPKYRSLSELKVARSDETRAHISKAQADWKGAHSQAAFAIVRCDDKYVSSPQYTTQSQKRSLERSQARSSVGLGLPSDLKCASTLSLGYVEKPLWSTKRTLNEARRKDQLESLSEKQGGDQEFINSDRRLASREEKQVVIVRDGENKTWTSIKEQQRVSTNEYNHKTFSERSIGIHGKELPKFTEHKPAYWEESATNELQKSRVKLVKAQRYWGSDDPLKIADVEEYVPPAPLRKDCLKTAMTPELTEKPNGVVHNGWRPRDPADPLPPAPKHNYRWSTMVHYFAHGSVFAPPSSAESKGASPKLEGRKEVRIGTISNESYENQSSILQQTGNSARSNKISGAPAVRKGGNSKQPQRLALKTSGFAKSSA
jgi:hypothetical protein